MKHETASDYKRGIVRILGQAQQTAGAAEQRRFLALLERLVSSEHVREREIAFYLIRHTKPTTGIKGVVVDEVLHPLLRSIFLDPDLAWLAERYQELFRLNLADYETLVQRRQRILAAEKPA